MEDLLTKDSVEFKELIGQIRTAHKSVMAVRERHRPTVADERYLKGEEVMEYLHISPRTLQNLRDNRQIPFTTIGGKILYPERGLQKVLMDSYQPVEPEHRKLRSGGTQTKQGLYPQKYRPCFSFTGKINQFTTAPAP